MPTAFLRRPLLGRRSASSLAATPQPGRKSTLLLRRSLLPLVLELPTSSPLLLAPIVLPLLAPIFFLRQPPSLLQALISIPPLPQLVAAVSTAAVPAAASFNFFDDRRGQASIFSAPELPRCSSHRFFRPPKLDASAPLADFATTNFGPPLIVHPVIVANHLVVVPLPTFNSSNSR